MKENDPEWHFNYAEQLFAYSKYKSLNSTKNAYGARVMSNFHTERTFESVHIVDCWRKFMLSARLSYE